jgi:hypothetical protein
MILQNHINRKILTALLQTLPGKKLNAFPAPLFSLSISNCVPEASPYVTIETKQPGFDQGD